MSADLARPTAERPRDAVFLPLYKQIKSLLVQQLDQGEWRPGEPIPSELDLAARFQVSQGTVRKAVDELAAENLLVRRQGKGTFVASHHEPRAQFRFLRLVPDEGEAAASRRRPTSWPSSACEAETRSSICAVCSVWPDSRSCSTTSGCLRRRSLA